MGKVDIDTTKIPNDGSPLEQFFDLVPSGEKHGKKKSKNISGSIKVELKFVH